LLFTLLKNREKDLSLDLQKPSEQQPADSRFWLLLNAYLGFLITYNLLRFGEPSFFLIALLFPGAKPWEK